MLLLRSRKILAVIVLCIVFKNFKLQDAERVSVAPKKQNPTIDIVSIGSKTKYEFQRAQHATFGSHPFVRFFFNITEDDDVEQDCSTRLQWTDALQISDFCRGRRKDIKEKYNLLHNIKGWFQIPHKLRRRADKKGVAGWLCAQKRPMAGLWKAVQKYRETSQDGQLNLPDYLMIMDDDTYYNMNSVVEGLREHEQQEQLSVYELKPFVVAGCIIRFPPRPWQWSIPYGGWGTIFSKGALQAMLQPLNCSATVALRNATTTTTAGSLYRSPDKKTEYYSSILCPSIQNDLLGERKLFQDGMSLTDLMYRYVMHEPYTNYANWDVGFCLHSDWVWACKCINTVKF